MITSLSVAALCRGTRTTSQSQMSSWRSIASAEDNFKRRLKNLMTHRLEANLDNIDATRCRLLDAILHAAWDRGMAGCGRPEGQHHTSMT